MLQPILNVNALNVFDQWHCTWCKCFPKGISTGTAKLIYPSLTDQWSWDDYNGHIGVLFKAKPYNAKGWTIAFSWCRGYETNSRSAEFGLEGQNSTGLPYTSQTDALAAAMGNLDVNDAEHRYGMPHFPVLKEQRAHNLDWSHAWEVLLLLCRLV